MRLKDLRSTTIADSGAFLDTLATLYRNSAKNTGTIFLGSMVRLQATRQFVTETTQLPAAGTQTSIPEGNPLGR